MGTFIVSVPLGNGGLHWTDEREVRRKGGGACGFTVRMGRRYGEKAGEREDSLYVGPGRTTIW